MNLNATQLGLVHCSSINQIYRAVLTEGKRRVAHALGPYCRRRHCLFCIIRRTRALLLDPKTIIKRYVIIELILSL